MEKIERDIHFRGPLNFLLAILVVLVLSAAAHAQPTFSKAFAPNTIGLGSISTLTFTIVNGDQVPVTDLSFVDSLPAGVTVADPSNAFSSCTGGTLTAVPGSGTITLAPDGFGGPSVGANMSCVVVVNVVGGSSGAHDNVSGALTSSAGDSGTASATLTVAFDRPGFTKSFSPAAIGLGERSTLTFTIDNQNEVPAANLTFIDVLPTGVVVADPPAASTTCNGGLLAAVGGLNLIGYSPAFFGDASVDAGSSCTISVDVVGFGSGLLGNTSGELTSFPLTGGPLVSSGMAGATLEVTADPLTLIKSFTDDPVPPGGIATLEFTLINFDRNNGATNIAFTDDLSATLAGLSATGLPATVCNGGTLSGTTNLILTGASLGPGASCTFGVQLQVPGAAGPGSYPNTTSQVTADVGGQGVTGAPATDLLFVEPAPILTKSFIDDPVGAGGTVTLLFTITNTSPTSPATDIAFVDEFPGVLPTAVTVPTNGSCGVGSTFTFTPLVDPPPPSSPIPARLALTGGTLGPLETCGFSIVLDVASGISAGVYTNTTSPITATIGNLPVTGAPATDGLQVVGAPQLIKEFIDDPVPPGGTVTLEFTLRHDEFAPADATGISFTDDLASLAPPVPGLTAASVDSNSCTGSTVDITTPTLIDFSGGTLAPGEICSFSVTLNLPAGALPGFSTNTTSPVTATVGGVAATGNAATDDLLVTGLLFSKEFTDDPVIAGGTVTLQFTLDNTTGTTDATGISFTDNLNDVLPGAPDLTVVPPLPTAPCGAASTLVDNAGLLVFSDGEVPLGNSCTFTVTLSVPAGTPDDVYVNTTSPLALSIVGIPTVFLNPATDTLTVQSGLLALSKTFTDDPVTPGSTVTLEFTLMNLHPTLAASSIAFTDDLGAALPSLAATGLPAAACGGTLSGASVLTFSGGSLAGGASCTFSVSLNVPASASLGTVATNTTSQVTGTIGGLAVFGDPASDNLEIALVSLSKGFGGTAVAGGTVVLSFAIQNVDPTNAVINLGFQDDLSTVLPGLVATGLPLNDVCGTGSQLAGTSVISLTGGSLGAGASCFFDVTLLVPAGATPGSYVNTTSSMQAGGLTVGPPASATVTVAVLPGFTKIFAPPSVVAGGTSALTFTVDNTVNSVAATGLGFSDNLPAGLVIASPPNASTTCGGTLTALAGTSLITLSGGTVGAGASCTVQVNVTANSPGTYVNTSGALTSNLGTGGAATATLDITSPGAPGFSKAFAPASILAGGTSTLTFTVDNTANGVAATNLDFSDNLPAGLLIANPPNPSTSCGSTLSPIAGTGVITLTAGTVGAGASCTVQVNVTANSPGSYVNTSGALTSNLGSSGTANATLTVVSGVVVAAPTLNEWGMILLGGLLALGALRRLRHRVAGAGGGGPSFR